MAERMRKRTRNVFPHDKVKCEDTEPCEDSYQNGGLSDVDLIHSRAYFQAKVTHPTFKPALVLECQTMHGSGP